LTIVDRAGRFSVPQVTVRVLCERCRAGWVTVAEQIPARRDPLTGQVVAMPAERGVCSHCGAGYVRGVVTGWTPQTG
jgi:hypothetical protein